MTPLEKQSWNKIIALCASIGLPLASAACWLIVSGTQLVDTVRTIKDNQTETHVRLDLLDLKMDRINHRIDTLSIHLDKQGLYEQRWVNGRLIFVPAK